MSVGATTDNDLHELTFPRGLHLMYYVLWAGNDGYHYKRDAFQAVLDRLADNCAPSLSLSLRLSSSLVLPSS